MSRRKPPRKRHTEPRWVRPRKLTEAKRVLARAAHLVNFCKAKANMISHGAAALGEDPSIPPLGLTEPTQVLWSRRRPQGHYTMTPQRFTRFRNLINPPEGSPLCN